ncbi:MAG: NADH-quinone oxidoreductase subunit NuoK [Pirellulales bacterium]|nr:NADH-quinone oxidoreductase subunit NuoK [Pirellulales bacterium]
MNEIALLQNSLIVGALLFCIGLVGFLARRNMIIMFICAEMMLQGVAVSLIAWGRYHNDWGGQMLVIFILTVAACEAGLALAIILMLFARTGRLDIAGWSELREDSIPAYIDQELDEDATAEARWPKLTVAGVLPAQNPEQEAHRGQL